MQLPSCSFSQLRSCLCNGMALFASAKSQHFHYNMIAADMLSGLQPCRLYKLRSSYCINGLICSLALALSPHACVHASTLLALLTTAVCLSHKVMCCVDAWDNATRPACTNHIICPLDFHYHLPPAGPDSLPASRLVPDAQPASARCRRGGLCGPARVQV